MFLTFHICLLFAIQTFFTSATRHHIVFLLHDDIGWSDIYGTNGQFETPFIDQLREESVILDRHYIHYVCSISRSQFLTGRKAWNHGYGKMQTFGFTTLGGIPIGQPTIANWLRDFTRANKNGNPNINIPQYKTYGVGKWHIGYASEVQTPYSKGFDHYYGFYQSGIDYKTKMHYHSGNPWKTKTQNQYDFFEDESIAYSAVNVTTNTMDLYDTKIAQYLDDFTDQQMINPDINLYLYVGVQTLHGPLSTAIPKYTTKCEEILGANIHSTWLKRLRICEYTRMTDDWLRDLIHNLKLLNLWDDTLLVFTADNGANIGSAACNYPLRGSKMSYFDGNIREFAFVTGGANVINPSIYGEHRTTLVSNLDWTPTLLSYAGILPYIDSSDYEWDGKDQMDIILNGDDSAADDSLVISINSPAISNVNNINSYSILFKYQDSHIYKYILTDPTLTSDTKWMTKTDGWCTIDFSDNRNIDVTMREDSDWAISAKISNSQFLFDLTEDEGEKYNLMRNKRIEGRINNKAVNRLIKFAKGLLRTEINLQQNVDYYHEPIECLYDFEAAGNPWNFPVHDYGINGLYIEPFLTKHEYVQNITVCLDSLNGIDPISTKLRHLYLNEWSAPAASVSERDIEEIYEYHVVNSKDKENYINYISLLSNGYVEIFAFVIFVVISLFCVLRFRFRNEKDWGKDETTPLLMNSKV